MSSNCLIVSFVQLGIWASSVGLFIALFPLTVGVACIWASYQLPVERVYNMRLSGIALTLIGLYFLLLGFGSRNTGPAIPGGPGLVLPR